tara:strand:- start:727 stop:1815 length:1089 start_codon:yes stop_codon:yes gene_type:complete
LLNYKNNKILIDCTSLDGTFTGLGTYVLGLVYQYESIKKFQFYYLSTLIGKSQLLQCVPGLTEDRIHVVSFGIIGFTREVFFLKNRKLLKQFDLYHCLHSYAPLFLDKKRLVVTIHDLKYVDFPAYIGSVVKSLAIRLYIRNSFLRSAACVCISHFTRKRLKSRFGHKFYGNTKIIYHGSDNRLSTDVKLKTSGSKFLLFVGENRPHKNIKNLLLAFKIIREKFDNINLFIVGKGFEKYDNHQNVKFLGEIDNKKLNQLYAQATCFVFASLYEGFGLPIIEAMSRGTPVVTSFGNACEEISGGFAITVDPKSPASIAEGIALVLNGEANIQTELAMEHALCYKWSKSAESHIELYETLLSNN